MTQRYAPIPLESMNPEQKRVAEDLINGPRKGLRGPFNALLRNPRMAERVGKLGDSIRFENSLPDVLREFAIMITAKFWSADYEWYAHSKLALQFGLSPNIVEDVREDRFPQGMTAEQELIYKVCTEILFQKDISDSTYSEALKKLGELSLLDLLATVGYFGFVSVILNAIRQPIPADATPLKKIN
jgi:4-carboxymuconolactone decarboxylase